MLDKRILLWIFTYNIIYSIILIETSNIDTLHPIIIKNGVDGPESLFGTSVILVKDINNNSPGVIIGAPRANSTLDNHKAIYEPGVLWQCSFTKKSEACRILTMDESGNDKNESSKIVDKKDGGWLGGCMAQDGDNFVSCGSRWINQADIKTKKKQYYMNGICYWRSNKDIFSNVLPAPSKESRLLPLIQADKQSKNVWNLGQAGFSIHFPARAKEMVIGAPGINRWKGSVVKFSNDGKGNPFGETLVLRPDEKEADDSYFGFTIASGKFLKTDRDDLFQYVSGAPRGNNLAGEVTVFKFLDGNKEDLIKELRIQGEQIGSYFGSSICVADINNDGQDDLIVGAPQYTILKKSRTKDSISLQKNAPMDRIAGYGDEGAVFVYLSTGTTLNLKFNARLSGRNRAWSHFGTAIANLGDINDDGYADIAVGAPYEMDRTGVVYIYLGGKNGIVKQHDQAIEAGQIDLMLRGFGYSLSERKDIDGNGYNDLAIGAYDSGQVVILRTRPLIQVHGEVTSEMESLSFDTTSFKIESCVNYSGKHIVDKIEFQIRIFMDVESRPPRVLLKISEQSGSTATDHSYLEEGYKGKNICTPFIAVVTRPLESSRNPVVIRQEISVSEKTKSLSPTIYEIVSESGKFITKESGKGYDEFCRDCPMLDKSKSTIHDLSLPLRVKCGNDNECVSDLELSVGFEEAAPQRPYVIGSSQVLTMKVKVTNKAETAIAPYAIVVWKRRKVRKMPSECELVPTNDTISSYKCKLGNFLEEDKSASITFEIDMTDLVAGSEKDLWFKIEAITTSILKNPSVKEITIPLDVIADLHITGFSLRNTFNPLTLMSQLRFSQTFEVKLDGPSPIPAITVVFSLPISFRSSSSSPVTEIEVYEPMTTSQTLLSCNPTTGNFASDEKQNPSSRVISSQATEDVDVDSNAIYTPDRHTEPKGTNTQSEIQIECGSSLVECMQVKCDIDLLNSNISAMFNFPMSISSKNLKRVFYKKEVLSLKIISYGVVTVEDNGFQIVPYSNKSDKATTTTLIELESGENVSKWIYWGSVILAFLILIVLVSCLYSCGCFERKNKLNSEEENAETIPLQDTGDEEISIKDKDDR